MKYYQLSHLISLVLVHGAIAATTNSLPPVTTNGDVSFVSGGIGQAESAAFKKEASAYPVEMEFLIRAKPHDEYTSDVQVNVFDSHQKKVISAVAQGPFLLARLPNGKYRVEAINSGVMKSREIHVKGGTTEHVIFEWPM